MNKNSKLMNLLLSLGMDSLAWAIRKFYTPVSKEALVLEVGSGGNPFPRSNVLLDAYEDSRERHWAPLTSDRPTVLGFVENLPFKDKSFDFVIASHVLEHSSNPEKFISELQRVAKAGYIEVPDAFLERINPYKDHRLEITLRNDALKITKKGSWVYDPDIVELYESRVKNRLTKVLIPKHPFEFHVRYYWEDTINYSVANNATDAAWPSPESQNHVGSTGMTIKLKTLIRDTLRYLFSQNQRNKRIDISHILRCPKCFGESLNQSGNHFVCGDCNQSYIVRNGISVMNR